MGLAPRSALFPTWKGAGRAARGAECQERVARKSGGVLFVDTPGGRRGRHRHPGGTSGWVWRHVQRFFPTWKGAARAARGAECQERVAHTSGGVLFVDTPGGPQGCTLCASHSAVIPRSELGTSQRAQKNSPVRSGSVQPEETRGPGRQALKFICRLTPHARLKGAP